MHRFKSFLTTATTTTTTITTTITTTTKTKITIYKNPVVKIH
jgi:hypothetical protein